MRFAETNSDLIQGFWFEIRAGEIVAMLGPSGIGKTTLLRIIAGLERRYVGEVVVDGQIRSKPGRDIQLLFQDYCLLPWMNVIDNVRFSANKRKRTGAEKLLNDVGLHGMENRWPKQLSGGEVARVALARALFSNPRILLLDEPFSNVDIAVKNELQTLLVDLVKQKKISVVLVTHNLKDAVMVSDRVLVANTRPIKQPSEHLVEVPHPRSIHDETVKHQILHIQRQLLSNR